MNQPSDKKVFPMQLRRGKVFNITVSVINKIFGWVWNIRDRIVITANALLLLKFTISFRIKDRISGFLKALYRFSPIGIKVPRVRTVYLFKMLMRVIQSIQVKSPRMTLIFKMTYRMFQTVKIPRVRIAYTPIVALFIILGKHDYSDYPINTSAYTLGNRDVLDLGDMDGTYY